MDIAFFFFDIYNVYFIYLFIFCYFTVYVHVPFIASYI